MKQLSPVELSERLYGRLLILYPPRFRQEYGREMVLVFRSQCRHLVEHHSVQHHGQAALAQLWLTTLMDLLKTALAERMKEGYSMSRMRWIQLCGLFAVLGGLLGTYLALQGSNSYGNYGWDGDLAPVASILLTVGFVGWFIAYREQLDGRGRTGFIIGLIGFLGMALGYLIEPLWALIFLGPAVLVPIGGTLLGISLHRRASMPLWSRVFPFVIAAIGILAFGIEAWEEFVQHYSTPDRGVQAAQLALSVIWLGLGLALLLTTRRSESHSGVL